jgi:CDP-glucose 4,6-dehydratase
MFDNLKNKNILVTGAAGLVGSHLVEKLLELKSNVIGTVRSENPNSYFIEKKLDKKIITVVCDIKDKERILDIIVKYEIDHIFHIAAQPIVTTAFVNPYETFQTNIIGTINILEASRINSNVKSIIVASSDKAYGKECKNVNENSPLRGDHPYDVSKSCTDLISFTYFKTYLTPVSVSRFGNIFGPGDLNFNRIVPGIFKSIILNVPLIIRSDGKFKRDYLFVKDAVNGYLALSENINKTAGEAFNFGTEDNYSVTELIKEIENILGLKCDYKIINSQINEIPFQSLDYSKAKKLLGWKCSNSFDESIKITYDWYLKFFKEKKNEL